MSRFFDMIPGQAQGRLPSTSSGQRFVKRNRSLRTSRWRNWLLIAGVLAWLLACTLSADLSQMGSAPPTAGQKPSSPDWLDQVVTQPAPMITLVPSVIAVDGEERRLIELFQQSNPAVVHVRVDRQQPDSAMDTFRRQMLRVHDFAGFRGRISDPDGGSGFVFDDDGLILTTNRVIANARDIQVTFADRTTSLAYVIGADPNTDLAVLKVSRLPTTVRQLVFGDSESVQVGQRVVALGNPLGYGGAMTAGVISAKARNVRLEIQIDNGFFTAPDLLQTDATIMAGTVGGPLLDLDGRVVGVLGIDTLEFDAAGVMAAGGVGFSIPASTVRRVVPVLVEDGWYPYPWLGISGQALDPDLALAMNLPPDQRGVLVVRVTPDSPAAKAGLRGGDQQTAELGLGSTIGGDVIVGFQGRPVRDFDELVSLLFREGTVGETVTLTILRDGEQKQVPITLEERPR